MKLIRIGNTIINATMIREAYFQEAKGKGDADHCEIYMPDYHDTHAVEFRDAEARALITWLKQNAEELPLDE
jgi:hypothetical protein